MTDSRKVTLGALAWVALISAAHGRLNVDWSSLLNDRLPEERRRLNVAYIPVT